MESFNKVLYFILGLVVVLVFIIVFAGRLNLSERFKPLANISPSPTPKEAQKGFFSFFGGGAKATPTPTKKPVQTVQSTPMSGPSDTGVKGGSAPQVTSIPATGSPIQILYLAVPALTAGLILRKRS